MGCTVITERSALGANQIRLQQKGQIEALPQSAVGCSQAFLYAGMWAGRRWDSAATPAVPVSVFPAGGRGWRKPWCHIFEHSDNGSILLLRWHSCFLLVHNLLDEALAPAREKYPLAEMAAPARQGVQPFRVKSPLHNPAEVVFLSWLPSPPSHCLFKGVPLPHGPGVRLGPHKPTPLKLCGSQLMLGHHGGEEGDAPLFVIC